MRPFLYRFSLIAGAKATGNNDTCIFECQEMCSLKVCRLLSRFTMNVR